MGVVPPPGKLSEEGHVLPPMLSIKGLAQISQKIIYYVFCPLPHNSIVVGKIQLTKQHFMKTFRLILLIPALLLMNFKAANPQLTSDERKFAVDYLSSTRKDLLKSIKGLSQEQLNFKSTPESWSVAECVEHIAISETNLFGMIQGTLKEEANPEKRKEIKLSDEAVFNAITDRSYKVKTQEAFVPTGKFGSHEATIKEFLAKRDANINYIRNTSDDLRNHFFTFPVESLGTVDSYQLFLFMAGHTNRHRLQIEEVKSNPAFPKKK